ncbi:MAG TPA: PIN domain-containing protein [Pyrinomonadaceae bacterium]|jgi:predicted nucleic acid-binding protein|nr:PIN domain-containing protein [Pyrinomonadaceae bacterium]
MKLSVYLETSVIGAYLDNQDRFRRDLTIRWFERELAEYEAFVSGLVRCELSCFAEPHRTGYLNLLKDFKELEVVDEAAILAEGYIERGLFQRKFLADALHVAIASIYKIDYLVTWNFGHIANARKQTRIRLFNTSAGFFSPQIVTPEFLVQA